MKKFKDFLKENVDSDNLQKTIERFSTIEGIKTTEYYLKAGSTIFALALFNLINKKGNLFLLSDEETQILHVVVKIDDEFWDINGGNDLERKEEFITIVGKKEWKPTTYEYLVKEIDNPNEILKVYKKLKNIYVEKQY